MSLANQPTANTPLLLLASQSATNTAAATTAWTAVAGYEGQVQIVINVGTITGTIDFTFYTNSVASDSGQAEITPLDGALAQVTTSNDVAVYVARIDARVLRGYLKVVGTVVTGPALLSYTLMGRKKTV